MICMNKYFNQEYNVKFSDCDVSNTVYNSNYFLWFEEARFGIAQEAKIMTESNDFISEDIYYPVIEASCKFLKPIPCYTNLLIKTCLKKSKFPKLEFKHTIMRKETNEILTTAKTVTAIVSRKKGMLLQTPLNIEKKINEYFNC